MLCLPANDESRTYITSDDVDSHSALDPPVSTDDPPSQLQYEELDEELDEVLNVEEPSIVRRKSRLKGSVNKRQKTFDNITRREPSLFEIDQVSLTETIRVTSSQILHGSLSEPCHSTSRRSRGRQNAGPRGPPSSSISGVPDIMFSSFRI
ncbi:hypothetical protein K3495_g6533 [Podosphaera aphanis]|nr:hypothetical protein K3495_g6533 [Podosphaera aphanis]